MYRSIKMGTIFWIVAIILTSFRSIPGEVSIEPIAVILIAVEKCHLK